MYFKITQKFLMLLPYLIFLIINDLFYLIKEQIFFSLFFNTKNKITKNKIFKLKIKKKIKIIYKEFKKKNFFFLEKNKNKLIKNAKII